MLLLKKALRLWVLKACVFLLINRKKSLKTNRASIRNVKEMRNTIHYLDEVIKSIYSGIFFCYSLFNHSSFSHICVWSCCPGFQVFVLHLMQQYTWDNKNKKIYVFNEICLSLLKNYSVHIKKYIFLLIVRQN